MITIQIWNYLILLNNIRGHGVVSNKVCALIRLLATKVANIIIPLCCKVSTSNYSIQKHKNRQTNIIVSFTSFPARIEQVWLVFECMVRQTLQPDQVILYLSKEQFEDYNKIPRRLLNQRDRGLQIELCPGDLRSHKKYYYSFMNYPQDLVILVDDDLIYSLNMVEDLYNAWDKIESPKVLCSYGRLIKRTNNIISPYNDWKLINEQNDSSDIFFGSGGGTMIQPCTLFKDVCKKELFLKLTPLADDIWLNAMARLNNVNIIKVRSGFPITITNKNNQSLSEQNLREDLNDNQIKNVNSYYSVELGRNVFV